MHWVIPIASPFHSILSRKRGCPRTNFVFAVSVCVLPCFIRIVNAIDIERQSVCMERGLVRCVDIVSILVTKTFSLLYTAGYLRYQFVQECCPYSFCATGDTVRKCDRTAE